MAAGGIAFAGCGALLGLPLSISLAIPAFLGLGLVAGLTESAERSLVARLAPKRTGRGFGAYHAVTGLAALPAATGFGALYQEFGGSTAAMASAAGMVLATALWLAQQSIRREKRWADPYYWAGFVVVTRTLH